jgi:hypothetical protein
MSKIYHYTSIEILALILSSHKIRFTRLDLLDDMLECEAFPQEAIFLAQSIYASSWTRDSEENIPLWKMYSSIDKGIRIAMPEDLFNHYIIEPFSCSNHGISKRLISPFTKEQLLYNGEYLITNIFNKERHDFFKDVTYINDVKSFYQNSIHMLQNSQTGLCDIRIENYWDFGKYKEKKWEFQKESRFVLFTKKLLSLSHPLINENIQKQFDPEAFSHIMPNDKKYIDVEISDEAFKQMEITLPPCITPGYRIIVESLIKQYNPTAIIHNSTLKLRK